MIGKNEIAEAVRYGDALTEEHGDLPGYLHGLGVDIDGLGYVAMQRGLRMVMKEKGLDPNQAHPVAVSLTPAEQERQLRYASVFMDGFTGAVNALKGRED